MGFQDFRILLSILFIQSSVVGKVICEGFARNNSSIHGSTKPEDISIIIVGSGASGIAAASRLWKNGFTNLTIIEAENRLGGRIYSIKFDDNYVDLGAEYLHGQEGNIVYDLVKQYSLVEAPDNGFRFYRSDGEILDNDTGKKIMEFSDSLAPTTQVIEGCESTKSVGECLRIKLKELILTSKSSKEKEIISDIHYWAGLHLQDLDGTFDLDDLKLYTEYITLPGEDEMVWKGMGFKTIIDILLQKYPDEKKALPIEERILFNKTVKTISYWGSDKVTISTEDSTIYHADHVIFTPSIGVLKANHQKMFYPLLPRKKIEAIENSGYGSILKLILHFSRRWWNGNAYWSILWTREDRARLKEENMDWLTSFRRIESHQNNPKVMTAWAAGENVISIEKLPEIKIGKGIERLLNTFFARHFNISLPDRIIRTQWYNNPHFRGTYTYESLKGHSNGKGGFPKTLGSPLLNINGQPTVLFAGEATHSVFFSTVHGAIESGFREAERLINLYTRKSETNKDD